MKTEDRWFVLFTAALQGIEASNVSNDYQSGLDADAVVKHAGVVADAALTKFYERFPDLKELEATQ